MPASLSSLRAEGQRRHPLQLALVSARASARWGVMELPYVRGHAAPPGAHGCVCAWWASPGGGGGCSLPLLPPTLSRPWVGCVRGSAGRICSAPLRWGCLSWRLLATGVPPLPGVPWLARRPPRRGRRGGGGCRRPGCVCVCVTPNNFNQCSNCEAQQA